MSSTYWVKNCGNLQTNKWLEQNTGEDFFLDWTLLFSELGFSTAANPAVFIQEITCQGKRCCFGMAALPTCPGWTWGGASGASSQPCHWLGSGLIHVNKTLQKERWVSPPARSAVFFARRGCKGAWAMVKKSLGHTYSAPGHGIAVLIGSRTSVVTHNHSPFKMSWTTGGGQGLKATNTECY